MPHVERARWIAAVLCGAWFVGFGWSEPRAILLAAPLVVAGVALLPRRVHVGAACVLGASFVTLVAGGSWGNVEMVLALAVALYSLGRASGRWYVGLGAVVLGALSSALREGLTFEKLALTLALYGATWGFGLVVRRRAVEAHEAVARASELAREDPAVTAARLAVEERAALAHEALFALRTAIVRMRTLAHEAEVSLDPEAVREIHERGGVAVDELRELLGLLREPPATEPDPTDPQDQPEQPGAASSLPRVACLVLAALSLVLAAEPPSVPELLLPVATGYAIAAWATAVRPSRGSWLCLAVLTAAGVTLSAAYGPRGAGFVVFVVMIATLAGLAWSERDRILRDARRRSGTLRERLDRAAEAAVRAERLRLARELHDVASHSVGAMVLHAGAAGALRERNPARARSALRTIVTTGEDALADVDEMLATLGGSGLDHDARTFAGPGRLRTALERHVASLRESGSTIRTEIGELPSSPALTATTYRVAHEGLANAVRHAPGAAVDLVATRDGDTFVLRVHDDGPGISTRQGTGFGLDGLRERVLACDGTFTAGPGASGGFLLEVRLPVAADQKGTPS